MEASIYILAVVMEQGGVITDHVKVVGSNAALLGAIITITPINGTL